MLEVKGQLTLEYLISFLVFIGLITYIYFSYSANIPMYMKEVTKEDTRSKAYQLSEILVNDIGKPANWDDLSLGEIKRVGLSDEHYNKTNLISRSKIDKLGSLCSDFKNIQEKLAIDQLFSVYILDVNPNTGNRQQILSCSPLTFPKKVINATVKRITAYNESGEIKLAELIVQM